MGPAWASRADQVQARRWRILDDVLRVLVEWNFPPEAGAGLRKLDPKIQVAERTSDEFADRRPACAWPRDSWAHRTTVKTDRP